MVEHLLPVSGASRLSRDVATGACLAWDLTPRAETAALIAGELVSHTIDRASTLMTFMALLDDDVLYLSVRGGNPSPPVADQDAAALNLLLIDSFADRWGVLPDDGDTVIWAAVIDPPVP